MVELLTVTETTRVRFSPCTQSVSVVQRIGRIPAKDEIQVRLLIGTPYLSGENGKHNGLRNRMLEVRVLS